jgi:hypothetical protein
MLYKWSAFDCMADCGMRSGLGKVMMMMMGDLWRRVGWKRWSVEVGLGL